MNNSPKCNASKLSSMCLTLSPLVSLMYRAKCINPRVNNSPKWTTQPTSQFHLWHFRTPSLTSLYPVLSKNIALHRVYWHFIIYCFCTHTVFYTVFYTTPLNLTCISFSSHYNDFPRTKGFRKPTITLQNMHTTSVDGDRIFTKNNTLPISERVEGETVTRGWGFTRGG